MSNSSHSLSLCAAAMAVGVVVTPTPAGSADFLALDSFPGVDPHANDFLGEAFAVASDGTVAGIGIDLDETIRACLWHPDGSVLDPGFLPSGAHPGITFGISDDGMMAVGRGFVWTEMMGVTSGPLPVHQDVSFEKQVFVGRSGGAAVWCESAGSMTINLPGGRGDGDAFGVSSNGYFVVGGTGSLVANTREAFVWNPDGGATGLGVLSQTDPFSVAYDISPDGSVIVGMSKSSGERAVRWLDQSQIEVLSGATALFNYSQANAVSRHGRRIVGEGDTDNGRRAFVWDEPNGARFLKNVLEQEHGIDLTGWELRDAKDISRDGRFIVGTGYDPDGVRRAYRATLPPPLCEGDLNDDAAVNVDDITAVVFRLGLAPGDFGYEPSADADGDGGITVADIAFVIFRLDNSCGS